MDGSELYWWTSTLGSSASDLIPVADVYSSLWEPRLLARNVWWPLESALGSLLTLLPLRL